MVLGFDGVVIFGVMGFGILSFRQGRFINKITREGIQPQIPIILNILLHPLAEVL